jgi:hypothetical protein
MRRGGWIGSTRFYNYPVAAVLKNAIHRVSRP